MPNNFETVCLFLGILLILGAILWGSLSGKFIGRFNIPSLSKSKRIFFGILGLALVTVAFVMHLGLLKEKKDDSMPPVADVPEQPVNTPTKQTAEATFLYWRRSVELNHQFQRTIKKLEEELHQINPIEKPWDINVNAYADKSDEISKEYFQYIERLKTISIKDVDSGLAGLFVKGRGIYKRNAEFHAQKAILLRRMLELLKKKIPTDELQKEHEILDEEMHRLASDENAYEQAVEEMRVNSI